MLAHSEFPFLPVLATATITLTSFAALCWHFSRNLWNNPKLWLLSRILLAMAIATGSMLLWMLAWLLIALR